MNLVKIIDEMVYSPDIGKWVKEDEFLNYCSDLIKEVYEYDFKIDEINVYQKPNEKRFDFGGMRGGMIEKISNHLIFLL